MQLIENLTKNFARLPGLGPRSSRRLVLHLLENQETLLSFLIKSLQDAAKSVQFCDICGNMDSINPCGLCHDEKRDQFCICIVESVSDLWALERSRAYKGLYHVLGGVLSATEGIGPKELKIPRLIERIKENNVREIILATNPTLDGQTTSWLIAQKLSPSLNVKVTRLAHGIPLGGELDYMDDGTISTALTMRRDVSSNNSNQKT